MFAQVIILSPPFAILTYTLPSWFPPDVWQLGQRVLVPLGKTVRAGVISSFETESPFNGEIKYKNILWPLELTPALDDATLAMVNDLAIRQNLEPGRIIGQILPSGLKDCSVKLKCEKPSGSLTPGQIAKFPEKEKLAKDFLSGKAAFIKRDRGEERIYKLAVNPPWPIRPAAVKQLQILEYLLNHGETARSELIKKFSASSILNVLYEKGLIALAKDHVPPMQEEIPNPGFQLNSTQKLALDNLESARNSGIPQCRLLHGVTGSGKTAVYIELLKKNLSEGKNAFLLAPEVALAHKLWKDVSIAIPGYKIFLYHGYQSPVYREKIWRTLKPDTTSTLIIGTRSALFLPLCNPGCIILDEEHDASYKQDESFSYNAKELAWFRANYAKSLLLLGSATPDIKSYYASETGRMERLEMPDRISSRSLPPIEFIDIKKYSGIGTNGIGSGLLAPKARKALEECKNRGEQAVIFLNRRGYSPMVYCLDCAKIIQCPHCAIGLSYHKEMNKMVCHFCGYSKDWPSTCPACGKMNFLPVGEGTEKIAESLEAISGTSVLRLDRDSTKRPGSIDEILSSFANLESPYLTGTQMLSKGHHFPNVTLVIVADGDIGLNIPDYRAAERTFQLLIQAAGRAGRGKKEGQVLIQTRDPGHYCWEYIKNYDYKGFYESELARRKKRLYPPFTNLALLRFSFPLKDQSGAAALAEIAEKTRAAASALNIRLLGPAPAPIPVLRDRRRYQCMLKSGSWSDIRELHKRILDVKRPPSFRISLDLDPVNMM